LRKRRKRRRKRAMGRSADTHTAVDNHGRRSQPNRRCPFRSIESVLEQHPVRNARERIRFVLRRGCQHVPSVRGPATPVLTASRMQAARAIVVDPDGTTVIPFERDG
jgi:hypothetical protein